METTYKRILYLSPAQAKLLGFEKSGCWAVILETGETSKTHKALKGFANTPAGKSECLDFYTSTSFPALPSYPIHPSFHPLIIPAGHGVNIGTNFARLSKDTPVRCATLSPAQDQSFFLMQAVKDSPFEFMRRGDKNGEILVSLPARYVEAVY